MTLRVGQMAGAVFFMVIGATAAVCVNVMRHGTPAFDPNSLHSILLEHPQFLADHPDVLRAAHRVLQERHSQEEGAQRAELLSGAWARFLHPAFAPSLGSSAATITVLEFTDYTCDPCRSSARAVQAVLQRDPSVRVALMLLPTTGAIAEFAARVAYVAYHQHPERFARLHERLMGAQGELTEGWVLEQAAACGFDLQQVQDDLATGEAARYISQVRRLAQDVRVLGVPTFLHASQMLSGGVDANRLMRLISNLPPLSSPPAGAAPLPVNSGAS